MLVSKSLLSTIATAGKDDTRPVLATIRLYKEGENIVSVATDGYILSEVIEGAQPADEFPKLPGSADQLETEDVLIPAETAKKMMSAIKKNELLPILNYAYVGKEFISTTDLEQTTTLYFRSPEGKYPAYRELIEPKEEKTYSKATVNPKYLKQVLALFKDDYSIEISVSDDTTAPVFIRSEHNGIKKTAVIMPLKG